MCVMIKEFICLNWGRCPPWDLSLSQVTGCKGKEGRTIVRPIRVTTSVALRSLPSVALSSTLMLLI